MRNAAFVLGSLLIVSACTNGGITTRNELYVKEIRPHVSAAAQAGTVPIVVRNSPFAGDGGNVAVVRALQNNQAGVEPHLNFASASETPGYRIVLAFGGPPVGSSHYCSTPGLAPQATATSRTVIHATFCLGNQRLSEAVAETGSVQSPGDPQFARLSADLLSALLPTNHPNGNYSSEQPM